MPEPTSQAHDCQRRPPYKGVLAGPLQSVWLVERPKSSSVGLELWRGGFYGKGTLSRGEATWTARAQESGGAAGESLASKRRAQRLADRRTVDNDVYVADNNNSNVWTAALDVDPERYQLMPEEAFYLAGGVGLLGVHATLNIFFATKEPSLSISALWAQLRLAAGEEIERASTPQTPPPSNLLTRLDLDHEFAVKYAAYHYYRSRGWVVKSGIKFGAEYVLYKHGPIFRHSE
ncbi:tRNA splicing endonuclease subunit sen2 [Geranomyces variabilis]|nr:tRNA splicing endonuclease subunit sen2 [Geranomyces variabilis]